MPKALSAMREYGVEALLMGGQACVLYSAAEFSRTVGFAILASPVNLERLRAAMDALRAEVIAVPPFEAPYLERLRIEGAAKASQCRTQQAVRRARRVPGFSCQPSSGSRGAGGDLWAEGRSPVPEV
jgi:hypothetical protein